MFHLFIKHSYFCNTECNYWGLNSLNWKFHLFIKHSYFCNTEYNYWVLNSLNWNNNTI